MQQTLIVYQLIKFSLFDVIASQINGPNKYINNKTNDYYFLDWIQIKRIKIWTGDTCW